MEVNLYTVEGTRVDNIKYSNSQDGGNLLVDAWGGSIVEQRVEFSEIEGKKDFSVRDVAVTEQYINMEMPSWEETVKGSTE